METMIFIILLVVVWIIIFIFFLKQVADDKKIRNNIDNIVPFTNDYCYLLNSDKQTTLDALSVRNVKDNLEYTLNTDLLSITFSDFGASVEYQLYFYTFENKTYLKVSRAKLLQGRSNIPFKINEFFINKIGAAPVDYTYFISLLDTINH